MMEGPPVEEQELGPPEDELLGPPETVQVQERTALGQETTAPATPSAAEASNLGVVLPIDSESSATPKQPRAVELTTPTTSECMAFCHCTFGVGLPVFL